MADHSRFEVVHTGPRQFHARFVAANGEIVWVTESYTRRDTAQKAIRLMRHHIDSLEPVDKWHWRYPVVDERT